MFKISGGRYPAILSILALALFPTVVQNSYVLHLIILSLMFAVLALSWNFICGYAGFFTLGHQGFFGIGAYVSALLAMKAGISPWLGLLSGGIAASALGFAIGLPCLRLRGGAYIALTTLAFAEIARVVSMNLVDLTRGEMGLWGIPPIFGASRIPYYYLILVIFLIAVLFFYHEVNSSTGLALQAIRDSQDAAESLGVHLSFHKVYAFVVSSFFAGLVGAFYGHYLSILTPTSAFSAWMMVDIVAMTIIGGLGTLAGPVLTAFLITIGLEYLRAFGEYRLLIYGILLIVVILFLPGGLVRAVIPRGKKSEGHAESS